MGSLLVTILGIFSIGTLEVGASGSESAGCPSANADIVFSSPRLLTTAGFAPVQGGKFAFGWVEQSASDTIALLNISIFDSGTCQVLESTQVKGCGKLKSIPSGFIAEGCGSVHLFDQRAREIWSQSFSGVSDTDWTNPNPARTLVRSHDVLILQDDGKIQAIDFSGNVVGMSQSNSVLGEELIDLGHDAFFVRGKLLGAFYGSDIIQKFAVQFSGDFVEAVQSDSGDEFVFIEQVGANKIVTFLNGEGVNLRHLKLKGTLQPRSWKSRLFGDGSLVTASVVLSSGSWFSFPGVGRPYGVPNVATLYKIDVRGKVIEKNQLQKNQEMSGVFYLDNGSLCTGLTGSDVGFHVACFDLKFSPLWESQDASWGSNIRMDSQGHLVTPSGMVYSDLGAVLAPSRSKFSELSPVFLDNGRMLLEDVVSNPNYYSTPNASQWLVNFKVVAEVP